MGQLSGQNHKDLSAKSLYSYSAEKTLTNLLHIDLNVYNLTDEQIAGCPRQPLSQSVQQPGGKPTGAARIRETSVESVK